MARKDQLKEYKERRDFRKTSEPSGSKPSGKAGNLFVVQKHDARRLHWDFRLEADGVLKSWAVTKGPSPDPEVKRLAVRTEDHPASYADFEGNIPKGEYGGGAVMIWDRGTWQPVDGKSAKDLEDGHLHFTLDGGRMKGEWLLVRMKRKDGERRENWLLRKIDDDYAQEGDPLVEECLTSVATGRSMAEIAADKADNRALEEKTGAAFREKMKTAAKNNGRKAKQSRRKSGATKKPPRFQAPQLATLVDAVPAGNEWMHEIKFDGYRALVAAAGGNVRIYTRSGKDWTDKFGPLAQAVAGLGLPACLIDGEIVAYDGKGNPDFSTLQQVLKRGHGSQGGKDALAFHAFDLLTLDGEDLTNLPNIERKERLEALMSDVQPPIHLAEHVIGVGEELYRQMCSAGQEGIISKQVDGIYRSGRGRSWVKIKCTRRQEFVIAGWTESSSKGRPFASLVLAQHEDGDFVYKGKVGTGFDTDTLEALSSKFKPLARKTPSIEIDRTNARGVHWLTPKLVAEVAFAEFTADGRVRHGSFVGLRGDKDAAEVTPEEPADAPDDTLDDIPISSRDRVVFPDAGYTKGELADYYAAVAPLMLSSAANRPISLVRCPQGRAKKCFFQKHDSGGFGPHVHHVPIREKQGGSEDYLFLDDAAGIRACVQMGTIEFHAWGSRADDVESPDRMIFDLDPDEGLDFDHVKRAAHTVHKRLTEIGLMSYPMLTGGKGVHVIVPLLTGHSWDAHKDFAQRFAGALAAAEPERFTATMSKAKRKGKIFIDWLRNQRGSTAIAPYSARARSGAPVAVPISWRELAEAETARAFSISDQKELLKRARSNELKGWGIARQSLPDL